MTDHKAEAERIAQEVVEGTRNVLAMGNNLPLPQLENFNRNAGREMSLAQVHATLYLAEQQRVANLIALFALSDEDAGDLRSLGLIYAQIGAEIVESVTRT